MALISYILESIFSWTFKSFFRWAFEATFKINSADIFICQLFFLLQTILDFNLCKHTFSRLDEILIKSSKKYLIFTIFTFMLNLVCLTPSNELIQICSLFIFNYLLMQLLPIFWNLYMLAKIWGVSKWLFNVRRYIGQQTLAHLMTLGVFPLKFPLRNILKIHQLILSWGLFLLHKSWTRLHYICILRISFRKRLIF